MIAASFGDWRTVVNPEGHENPRLEFKLSIGFVHPGGFILGWFVGQMMEQGFRPFGCAN
jgi:hypothetical protein